MANDQGTSGARSTSRIVDRAIVHNDHRSASVWLGPAFDETANDIAHRQGGVECGNDGSRVHRGQRSS
jgi:hypothetical protein